MQRSRSCWGGLLRPAQHDLNEIGVGQARAALIDFFHLIGRRLKAPSHHQQYKQGLGSFALLLSFIIECYEECCSLADEGADEGGGAVAGTFSDSTVLSVPSGATDVVAAAGAGCTRRMRAER